MILQALDELRQSRFRPTPFDAIPEIHPPTKFRVKVRDLLLKFRKSTHASSKCEGELINIDKRRSGLIEWLNPKNNGLQLFEYKAKLLDLGLDRMGQCRGAD